MTESPTSELFLKVKAGNAALSRVWLDAVKLDDVGFEKQMMRIEKTWPGLDFLCQQLMFKEGFRGCLYDGNCDRTPVCWVCTRSSK